MSIRCTVENAFFIAWSFLETERRARLARHIREHHSRCDRSAAENRRAQAVDARQQGDRRLSAHQPPVGCARGPPLALARRPAACEVKAGGPNTRAHSSTARRCAQFRHFVVLRHRTKLRRGSRATRGSASSVVRAVQFFVLSRNPLCALWNRRFLRGNVGFSPVPIPGSTIIVTGRPKNELLQKLNAHDFELLAPHLQSVDLAANHILHHPGDSISVVHFPCGPAFVSFAVPVEDDREVESLLVGREGAVGLPSGRGPSLAYARIVVKVGGTVLRLPLRALEQAQQRSVSSAGSVRALRRLPARATAADRGLQRRTFDRAARGEMDHRGAGAHRRRRDPPHPRAARRHARRLPQLCQPRHPDAEGKAHPRNAPRRHPDPRRTGA